MVTRNRTKLNRNWMKLRGNNKGAVNGEEKDGSCSE